MCLPRIEAVRRCRDLRERVGRWAVDGTASRVDNLTEPATGRVNHGLRQMMGELESDSSASMGRDSSAWQASNATPGPATLRLPAPRHHPKDPATIRPSQSAARCLKIVKKGGKESRQVWGWGPFGRPTRDSAPLISSPPTCERVKATKRREANNAVSRVSCLVTLAVVFFGSRADDKGG